jgi:hypothetical protein
MTPKQATPMRNTFTPSGIAGLTLLLCFVLAPSEAGAIPRTWVSSAGSGAACTQAAPCASFQAAHDATDPAGQISCHDPGDFGPVIVTKSITIDCTNVGAFINLSSGTAVQSSTNVILTLRGLSIYNVDLGAAGILFLGGGELHVEHCHITSTSGNSPAFEGIGVTVNASPTKIYVSDTTISDGNTGIQLAGTTAGVIEAVLERIELNDNGFVADGQSATGTIAVYIRNSIMADSHTAGVRAFGANGHATVAVTLDRSALAGNTGGAQIFGNNAFILLGRSTVISNQTGLATLGAPFLSYGNNQLTGNVSDGPPPAAGSLVLR